MIKSDYFYKSEMLILSLLSQSDLEFFEIIFLIQKHSQDYIHMKNGILFTMLYHLENAKLISHYRKDKKDYYHLKEHGKIRYEMLKRDYQSLNAAIDQILHTQISEDHHHE